MAVEIFTQDHILSSGRRLKVQRKDTWNSHKYSIQENLWVPSVSSLTGHIEGNVFSIAAGWAKNLIRDSGGDIDAVKNYNAKALEDGNRLHTQIEDYITSKGKRVVEEPMFMAWYEEMKDIDFVATECFVYHSSGYGGTIDAIGIDPEDGALVAFDWKTKKPGDPLTTTPSWPKDMAQLSAYIEALNDMYSAWMPDRGVVCYVTRDGEMSYQRNINIELGGQLFEASWAMKNLVEKVKG
jgi:hypothetical protein